MKKVKGRLTVLADNIVLGKVDSLGEHGFSVYVETDHGNFLFDTGKGKTLVHNAIGYDKRLRTIKKIILSHGHADHTGGLPEVLRFHDQIDVLGHPDIFLHRFRKTKEGGEEYGGIPYARGFLEKLGARFIFNETLMEIENGMVLTGPVPRKTDFETGDLGNRYGLRGGNVVPELILDDQSLILNTDRGLVILLGCAHSGIINVIDHVVATMGTDDIFAILGGTHLQFSEEKQLEKTLQILKNHPIRHLIPGHCTGIEAAVRLSHEFPGTFQFCHVGRTFDF